MKKLQETIVDRLEELGVAIRVSSARVDFPVVSEHGRSPSGDVLAFVWVEAQRDSIVVHFYEAARTSLRERRIPVAHLDAASVEEVAVVVRSAVSALLERVVRESVRRGASRPEPAPRATTHAAPVDGAGAVGGPGPLRLSMHYVGQDYAPAVPWNHGLAMGLAWQGLAGGWSLGGSYYWFPAVERRTRLVGVRLRRHPGEVFLAWEMAIGKPWVRLRPEAAVGIDRVIRDTTSAAEDVEPTAGKGRWSWTASGRLSLVVFPMQRWQVSVSGGADYLVNRFVYTVSDQSQAPVIAPKRLRPHFSCGVALELP